MRRSLFLLPLVSVVFFAACDDDPAATPTPDGGISLIDSGVGPGADSGSPQGDASSVDAADDGAAPAPLVPDYYVNPSAGDDTRDGKTAATAFKTICKAKDVLQANQVIALADGAYDNTTQRPPNWALNPPCGPIFNMPVRIVALTTGQAIVSVPLTLAQGGEIRGIKLEYEPGLTSGSIDATGGVLVIRDLTVASTFSPPNAKSAPIVANSGAKITLYPGSVTNFATVPVPNGRGFSFAFIGGTSELTVEGGTIDDTTVGNTDSFCNPLFEGSGKITLNNMTIRHKGSIARVTGGTFIVNGGTLEDRATAQNSACYPAIDLTSNANVTLKDTSLGGGARVGIGTVPTSGGTLSLTNVTVSSFTVAGVDLNSNQAQPLTFSATDSKFEANQVGIQVANYVTTTLSNNIINGNTTRGLENAALSVVNAAGNTWIASQQEADANGKYSAKLDTGPKSGVNYSLASAAQTIQF